MERIGLCNFGKGHYEKYFCELYYILTSGLGGKLVYIFSSGHFDQRIRNVFVILVEGIMRNFFLDIAFGSVVKGDICCLKVFLF